MTIYFEAIPTHKATFSVNGVVTEKEFAEDSAITFDTPEDVVLGKKFVGWTKAAIDGTTNEKPVLVDLGTMGTADVTFYAVFANVTPGTATQVTDELTRETTGVKEEATYSDWSDKKVASDAVYAGQSAGDHNSIQLRSNNSNSGIITTTSGGKLKKVVVEWNSSTTDGRTLDVYGSNIDYKAATDLYNTSKQGTKLGSIVYGRSTELSIDDEYTFIGLRSNSGAMYLDKVSITWETGTPATYSDYCTTVVEPVSAVSAPVIFHDEGTYEGALTVAIAGGGTIKYTLNGGTEQTYSAPFTISETTTVKAWTEQDGNKSDEVSKIFTIVEKTAGVEVAEGYYTIKNNGNGKFVNVAGRKTVTFTDAIDDKAGTVLKVKTGENGQVEVLRSQGIDLPGYADRAMNYVPKIVKLVVEKLHAAGSGEILGEHGLDAIMQKFNDSFDYHLYIENANGTDNANGYRIYGKTPSMKPVVDFYAENKTNVDIKLPQLEEFINSAIQKVLDKTGGRGSSILTEFKLHDIWQKMGETLTEPVEDDAASIAKFYEEVLSSEANVWNFAYQTAMIYWGNVKNHPRYAEMKGKLGEYAKYIEKVENIRPNFKYYIVANEAGNDVDFISEGNTDINAARATWTLEKRTDFKVTFNKENSINLGRELYTTLYTDFAYTVPEKVKAYKVTAIDEKTGLATKEEITGVIPAQTPVLLQMIVDPKTVTDADLIQTLTLSIEAGTAVAGNLLQGPEWLINKYSITAKQVEDLFGYVHDFLKLADVEALYDSYVKEYEYLMIRNAGTVNNKYFFGLSGDDIAEAEVNVCQLAKQGNPRQRLAFYHNLGKVEANKAFIPSETIDHVYLSLIGDVNRDGKVNITDVTCQIDIVLDKDKPEDNYDYDAADLDFNDDVTISDVTDLIDVVLGKKTIE
ncbi:MAG: chitobiase/beta-hexosaminidase C-terminal domain-containing protein [Prevotella sp.]|nr:chitobiase/beta-hexosaminidase C-terminal domain-containing protein [Prevotella sp.]